MTLSKNDYLRLKENKVYRRVIEVIGEVICQSWGFEGYDDQMHNGALRRECADGLRTIHELEAEGWTKCTAQEAGAPKESWRPEPGLDYCVASFDGIEVKWTGLVWSNSKEDITYLALGNVHKTPEEAIAWLKSKLDLKV